MYADDPAFPDTQTSGLSKREYIATAIAAGLASDPTIDQQPEPLVKIAVRLADELIYELNKVHNRMCEDAQEAD